MTIDLYYLPESTPCRAVLLTANAVGLQLNLKCLDLFKGEHMTPQFLKVCDLINFVNSNWELRFTY
jgi:glutathione S-transferase